MAYEQNSSTTAMDDSGERKDKTCETSEKPATASAFSRRPRRTLVSVERPRFANGSTMYSTAAAIPPSKGTMFEGFDEKWVRRYQNRMKIPACNAGMVMIVGMMTRFAENPSGKPMIFAAMGNHIFCVSAPKMNSKE